LLRWPLRCSGPRGDRWRVRPTNHDHARAAGGLDQDNLNCVAGVVDRPARKGRGGMIGQGGTHLPSRLRWLLATPIGAAPTQSGIYFAPQRSQPAAKYAQMHSVGSSLMRDHLNWRPHLRPTREKGGHDRGQRGRGRLVGQQSARLGWGLDRDDQRRPNANGKVLFESDPGCTSRLHA
jgi:hypothetical protein